MESRNSPSKNNEAYADHQFRFIAVQNPDETPDRHVRRLVKSHAVKQGIQNKRNLQKESNNNFRWVQHPHGLENADQESETRILPVSLSATTLDVFGKLSITNSLRLEALLNHDSARQAAEPVFSVADDVVFQDFRSVFRAGLDDQALFNAVMFTFALALTGGTIDNECLRYQNQAMKSIRNNMNSVEMATTASTLGAILLLAGVEARLGIRSQVELHMAAIRQLLDVSKTGSMHLSDGIKRAIFWQDLNASVMTGSARIVDHTTFSELQWKRDIFSPNFFVLSPGFAKMSYLLTEDFIDVLKDIHALQCIRNSAGFVCEDTIAILHIDNHQAWVESRLISLPHHSSVQECCNLAAYLSACMLCCKVWRASEIPSHISLQLLHKLQHANEDPVWNHHPDLLTWILYIGGAFSLKGTTTRSDYISLLSRSYSSCIGDLYNTWPGLVDILKNFIWSDRAFEFQVKAFWEESGVCKN